MYPVKQSTALTVPIFVHDASGDAVTGLVDAGFTKRISKNGAAFGAMTVTITEMENGWYSVPLSTSHTDTLGLLTLTFTHASSKQVNLQFRVHARIPDDLAFPTTSGNSIDVTATGAVGIDWANVENQGTTVDLSSTSTNLVDTATTVTNDVGITAGAVDLIWDEELLAGTHNVVDSAGRRLRAIEESGGYGDGAVWIDTVNGTAGTTDFENGTVNNPVNSLADANSIAASVGLSRFRIAPGSSITLAASQQNQEFIGHGWTLDLGGQDVSGTFIEGALIAASTGLAATGGTIFYQCIFDAAVTLPPCVIRESYFGSGTITAGSSGDFFFNFCMSRVAGSGTPTFDFGAGLNASNLSMRHYSGGIKINNMGAGTGTYEMTLEGQGALTIDASCSATSNLALRGNFKVTDNAGGAVTVTRDDLHEDWADGGRLDLILDDIPTTAEFEARTLVAASYFDPATDTVANVTTTANVTNAVTVGTINANVITETSIAADAITSDKIAAGAITSSEAPNLDAAVSTRATPAQVNTEVSDVMKTDTITLPGQAAPPLTPTFEEAVSWLYKVLRNRTDQTSTLWQLYADNETTVDAKATVSDDGTTAIVQEIVSGP